MKLEVADRAARLKNNGGICRPDLVVAGLFDYIWDVYDMQLARAEDTPITMPNETTTPESIISH